MQQSAYNIRKVSGIGVGVVTFLSIATMSSAWPYDTLTTSMNKQFGFEGVPLFSDKEGEFCASSSLSDMVRGDVLATENDIDEFYSAHEQFSVQLKILEVKQHISKFDFEDEYEEI